MSTDVWVLAFSWWNLWLVVSCPVFFSLLYGAVLGARGPVKNISCHGVNPHFNF